jgi:hypothetical protein
MVVVNTLVYYIATISEAIKSFMVLATGVNRIKNILSKLTQNNLRPFVIVYKCSTVVEHR